MAGEVALRFMAFPLLVMICVKRLAESEQGSKGQRRPSSNGKSGQLMEVSATEHDVSDMRVAECAERLQLARIKTAFFPTIK